MKSSTVITLTRVEHRFTGPYAGTTLEGLTEEGELITVSVPLEAGGDLNQSDLGTKVRVTVEVEKVFE